MNIQEWYLPENQSIRDELHWELFKYCRSRSVALLGDEGKKDRFINLGQIGQFKKEIKAKFKQDNPYWDFYASVEHLAGTSQTTREEFKKQLNQGKSLKEIAKEHGTFKDSVKKRKNQLENNQLDSTVYFPANWQDHWYNFIYDAPGYDLVFDIDGDHLIDNPDQASRKEIVEAAQKEAAKIVEYLGKKKAPFYIKFSGGRGFHIGIPRDKIEKYFDNNNYQEVAGAFAQFIADKTRAEVDYSIYKDRQIYRVPYTMHTDSHLICMPLTNDQFWNFELKYASPDYIRNNIELRDRGLCTRSGRASTVIKEFKEWQEEEHEGHIPDKSVKNRGTSRVQKVIEQYKALTNKEKKQFMDKVDN